MIAEYFWEAEFLAYKSGPTNVILPVPWSSVQHVVLRVCRNWCCRLVFADVLLPHLLRGDMSQCWLLCLLWKPAAFKAKLSHDTTRYSGRRAQSVKLWKGTLGGKGSSSLTAVLKWCIKGWYLHLLSLPYFLGLVFIKSAHRLKSFLCLALFMINSVILAQAGLPRD